MWLIDKSHLFTNFSVERILKLILSACTSVKSVSKWKIWHDWSTKIIVICTYHTYVLLCNGMSIMSLYRLMSYAISIATKIINTYFFPLAMGHMGTENQNTSTLQTEWWGAGVVICLERGADLHMPSWCHCSLSLAPVKSRLVLPFWYRLTWVVPDKGPLNRCVCCCKLEILQRH